MIRLFHLYFISKYGKRLAVFAIGYFHLFVKEQKTLLSNNGNNPFGKEYEI